MSAVCFTASLFLAPLFLSIPAAATAPTLMLVGLMMLSSIADIDFKDYSESVPAFICVIMIPLAYSISDGIALGLLSYVIINLCCGKTSKLSVGIYVLAAFFLLKFFI